MNRKELIRLILILDPKAENLDNLSNKDLEALHKNLDAAAMKAAGGADAGKPPENPPAKAVKKGGYVVAAGKSITAPKGVIGPGEAIAESMFKNGKEVIARFLKSKHITKG